MDLSSVMETTMVVEDKPISLDSEVPTPHNLGPTPNVCALKVPEDELLFYKTRFEDVSAVKYLRIHCTSCDKHLGSAASDNDKRFEHPLLKVIVCERCYNFYQSGEFETDEDGSELYCRWCGQGGQVYCCSSCPFVFCKKCIRRNLGNAMVHQIEESDDWICYSCRPWDIWMHRAINWALKQYSAKFKSANVSLLETLELMKDFSKCCKKDRSVKKSQNKDNDYNPYEDYLNGKSKSTALKSASSSNNKMPKVPIVRITDVVKHKPQIETSKTGKVQEETEPTDNTEKEEIFENKTTDVVVCTPDILALDDDSPTPSPSSNNVTQIIDSDDDDDCAIIESSSTKPSVFVPKITYVQVKPASQLMQPQKQSTPIVKTVPVNNAIVQTSGPLMKPKLVKIVSPDGRSFYIDPKSFNVNQNSIMSSSTPSSSILQQQFTLSKWFDDAIYEGKNLKEFVSATISNFSKLQKITPAIKADITYHDMQQKLQICIEKITQMKMNLATTFTSWKNENVLISTNPIENIIPTTIVQTVKVANLSPVITTSPIIFTPQVSAVIQPETISENSNEHESNDAEDIQKIVVVKKITPANDSYTDNNSNSNDSLKAIDNKLKSTEKETTNTALGNDSTIKKKEIAELKETKNKEVKKNELKRTMIVNSADDDIYEMEVTCDSDIEEESLESSSSDVELIDEICNNENEDNQPSENTDDKNDKSDSIKENNIESIDETPELEKENSDVEENSKENEPSESLDSTKVNSSNIEKENETDSIENLKERINTFAKENDYDMEQIKEGSEDWLAIAEAIRESIIESKNSNNDSNEDKNDNDLEEYLSSNIVYKNPQENSAENNSKKRSFGEAFSNFITNNANDENDTKKSKLEDNVSNSENESDLTETCDLESNMEKIQKLAEKCLQEGC